jgi:hypothetical protein
MTPVARKAPAAVALLLAVLIPALTTAFVATGDEMQARTLPVDINPIPVYSASLVNEDVLWLARCIYSETKTASEQELVAWVIRNRVETGYRGQHTYEGVVTDPYQFSAFNPGSSTRALYTHLVPGSESAGWQRALEIAHDVYYAPASARPFEATTRHFYSERSMAGGRAPAWANGHEPVRPVSSRIDPRRFRFYSGVASAIRL